MRQEGSRWLLRLSAVLVVSCVLGAEPPPGEEPGRKVRIDQQDILDGVLGLGDLQQAGRLMFTTPFNRHDGYGDGPLDPADPLSPGGRPTLGGNGTFLRLNGLDAQTCLECHSIVSNAAVPAVLGVGGVGGSNSNAIIRTTVADPSDSDRDGVAEFDGRFANPPFLFGVGGVELLALEMTEDLQTLRRQAVEHPGTRVSLQTKGVSFGTIVASGGGELDGSGVVGIDDDLVVRPFGRKGEFATVREFDVEALQFHFGMQPTEVVGEGIDGDGDGVVDEVSTGELSALHVFAAMLERPYQEPGGGAARQRGLDTFRDLGCAECHVPRMETRGSLLPLRAPEVPTDPRANIYLSLDLGRSPPKFDRAGKGGLAIPLFSDLKRHDMGPGLAESFSGGEALNRWFVTARLWGIADTAPYLHDGRALTLTEAILAHGGEAQGARDAFDALPAESRRDLLGFLRTLRTPVSGG